jgi:uncharacterized protein (UPF0332 family)
MKREVIDYRRKRAKESLEEAKIMLDNKKLLAAVNRLYYSVFYQVVALLLTKDLSSSKHSGIRSLFNKEFVKTGIISETLGAFYNKIFEFRQRGDYEEFVEFEEEEVKIWFNQAKEFIEIVDQIIEKFIKEDKTKTN